VSLKLYWAGVAMAAVAVIAFADVAHAAVPIVQTPNSSFVSAGVVGGSAGPPAFDSELALPNLKRRRRLKLQFADFADFFPWGVIVVDERLRMLYASRRAMIALASRAGLISKKGVLHTERAALDRTLRDLVRLAISRDAEWAPEQDVIGIPETDGQLRYVLRVVASGGNLTQAVAVIAVSDLSSRSGICREAVERLFCLSDREAEFAELFATGCRLQEIALQMHVAVNTARVHLRNVFHKTGCSSQVELARKFAVLPLEASRAKI
jgi:DNA-binding CsgD family transcriptional regulator